MILVALSVLRRLSSVHGLPPGVLMYPDNVMQLEDAHKEAVIGAHFAACDWIRELVNAFVMEPKRHTKAKVCPLSVR